jgi:hypothetical protein
MRLKATQHAPIGAAEVKDEATWSEATVFKPEAVLTKVEQR